MPEQDMVLPGGFKNVSSAGQVTGFQLQLRTAYYRGVYLSLVEGFDVTIDGETFKREQIRFSLGNQTFTLDELTNLTDQRWPFRDVATLTVSKVGGLKVGMHDVQVVEKIRVPYMPIKPSTYLFQKKMPLVV
jgi:hypothetical protein